VALVTAFVPDLFFASKIEATLTAAGHEVSIVATPGAIGPHVEADVVIVDLDAAGTELGTPGAAPRLGFYSHVNVDTRRRAEQAGFDLVVPRSRMAREMPELVAGLVRGS
jgi:hypothetical protein